MGTKLILLMSPQVLCYVNTFKKLFSTDMSYFSNKTLPKDVKIFAFIKIGNRKLKERENTLSVINLNI